METMFCLFFPCYFERLEVYWGCILRLDIEILGFHDSYMISKAKLKSQQIPHAKINSYLSYLLFCCCCCCEVCFFIFRSIIKRDTKEREICGTRQSSGSGVV